MMLVDEHEYQNDDAPQAPSPTKRDTAPLGGTWLGVNRARLCVA